MDANLSSWCVLLQPVVYLGHHGGRRRLQWAAGQKQAVSIHDIKTPFGLYIHDSRPTSGNLNFLLWVTRFLFKKSIRIAARLRLHARVKALLLRDDMIRQMLLNSYFYLFCADLFRNSALSPICRERLERLQVINTVVLFHSCMHHCNMFQSLATGGKTHVKSSPPANFHASVVINSVLTQVNMMTFIWSNNNNNNKHFFTVNTVFSIFSHTCKSYPAFGLWESERFVYNVWQKG